MQKSTFRSVNVLFLIVLCLMAANLFFMWIPQYVRLILNEALFVFLPGYLYLRFTRQPVRERVRWKWPGWRVAILALLIGMGLYPFSVISAAVLQGVLGYTSFTAPADAIPADVLSGILAVVSLAVMAPLCEEFLFRGILQPVYETRHSRWGVLFVCVLFIAFHLSLIQGLSIILLSLALGFVNYRARSLPASILTHVGANSMAVLVITQKVFITGIEKWVVTLPSLAGGMLISALALFFLFQATGRPAEEAPVADPGRSPFLATNWPLIAALLIIVPMLGSEVIFSRSPQLNTNPIPSAPPLAVSAAPWNEASQWRYEITNVADTVVGEGECQLTSRDLAYEIVCTSKVGAYEVKRPTGTFASSGGERTDHLVWSKSNSVTSSGSTHLDLIDSTFVSLIQWTIHSDRIDISQQVDGKAKQNWSVPFSDTPLAKQSDLLIADDYAWPWQLAGMKLEEGATGQIARFNPYTWRNATQDSGPVVESRTVTVAGPEEVTTPAGHFTAWKVKNGDFATAWYDVTGSHTVVKFFNGVETWSLK